MSKNTDEAEIKEIDCLEAVDSSYAYLDGELDVKTCEEIERRTAECEHCASCLETLRHTRAWLRQSGQAELPESHRTRLRQALKDCLNSEIPKP